MSVKKTKAWRRPHAEPFTTPPPVARKGARTRAGIPAAVKTALDHGRDETVTLVEWLAVDLPTLLSTVLPDCGFSGAAAEDSAGRAEERIRAGVPFLKRLRAAAVDLLEALRSMPPARAGAAYARLASHRSDVVRGLAASTVAADDAPDLATKLSFARPFAADRNMGVREVAWEIFRTALRDALPGGLDLLQDWVVDPDPGVRRAAIEGSRPRGVWTVHLDVLKERPELALPLLKAVRADPSEYVRKAAGNWLNDAAKSRPEFVRKLATEWRRGAPVPATERILRRGLRSLPDFAPAPPQEFRKSSKGSKSRGSVRKTRPG